MKAYLCYTEVDGTETRLAHFGDTDEEIQKSMKETIDRLGWDIKYCSIGY